MEVPHTIMSLIQAIGLVYLGEMALSFLYLVVWKAMLRPGKNLAKSYASGQWSPVRPMASARPWPRRWQRRE